MSQEMQNTLSEPLQFDRVVHVDPTAASAMTCAGCGTSIAGTYYHDGDRTLCAACGADRQAKAAPDRRLRTMARALAFGLGAAVAGGIVYWAVMEYLDLQIGLVAIAIGYVVGRAVARATDGRSARRHRVLAVVLTYLAVAIAYAPLALKGAKEAKVEAAADSAAASRRADSVAATAPAASRDSAAATAPAKEKLTFGGFVIALAALGGLLFALPVMAAFMSMPGGILSLLIIGFGLRAAWRVAGASNAEVTGPLTVGGGAA